MGHVRIVGALAGAAERRRERALLLVEAAVCDALGEGASVSDVWDAIARVGSGWVLTPAGRAALEAADNELSGGAA